MSVEGRAVNYGREAVYAGGLFALTLICALAAVDLNSGGQNSAPTSPHADYIEILTNPSKNIPLTMRYEGILAGLSIAAAGAGIAITGDALTRGRRSPLLPENPNI